MNTEANTEANTVLDRKRAARVEMETAAAVINTFLLCLPQEHDGRSAKWDQRGPVTAARAKVFYTIAERHALAALAVGDFDVAAATLMQWQNAVFAGAGCGEYDACDQRYKAVIDALVATVDTMRKTISACRPQ